MIDKQRGAVNVREVQEIKDRDQEKQEALEILAMNLNEIDRLAGITEPPKRHVKGSNTSHQFPLSAVP